MSLFRKIKSAFIIEGEEGDKKQPVDNEGEAESLPKQEEADAPQIDITSYDTGEGKINTKFTNILLKAVDAHNKEGFDYIEFKRSLQNLKKMDMDEPTVYKSAFATAQTLGATPEGLIESANGYLGVLEEEERKFQQALANQRAKQIDGRMTRMQQMEETIRSKEAKIQQLQTEIEEHKAKLEASRGEIEEATKKVEATGMDFMASYRNLVDQIRKDVDNIRQYLN